MRLKCCRVIIFFGVYILFGLGSNLFGQWGLNEYIFDGFKEVLPVKDNSSCDEGIFHLIGVYWSYNIYRTNFSLYISGAWRGKKNQLSKINLPQACTESENLLVSGTDYKLIFVHKYSRRVWIMDLENINNVKELHFNELSVIHSPKKRKDDYSIKKVIARNNLLLCLTENGEVYSGMLPSLVNTRHCIGSVCDIQCGHEHFVLLTDVGRVYTWGNGRRLQLGNGDLDNLDTPTEVEALAGIKIIKICAGGWHSMALSQFGDLYAWGWNDTGQLGIKQSMTEEKESLSSCSIPTLVDIYNDDEEEICMNIKDIACGSRHSVILLEDNTIWTTGFNKYGQLGFSSILYPKINNFKYACKCDNIVKLLCGPWSTVIITDNNK